jgi:hypothetical protein
MHRHHVHVNVKLGEFREFYDLIGRLNELLATKGMTPLQLWAPSTGAEVNHVILISDHDSLAAWDSESRQFQTDAEVMKVWRDAGRYVDGRPRDELWETSYEIA